MQRYLAAERGESLESKAVAPTQPRAAPPAVESDGAWYAKMARYLAAQRAKSAGQDEALPTQAPASPEPSPTPGTMTVPSDGQRTRIGGAKEVAGGQTPNALFPAAAGGQLTIGSHVRDYTTGGGSPLSPRDQARLDAISVQALAVCERQLGPLLSAAARRVMPSLQVSVDLDLARLSDDEAAEAWGQRLAEVVRSRLRRGIAEIGGTSRPD
jgi:hypothetical protein